MMVIIGIAVVIVLMAVGGLIITKNQVERDMGYNKNARKEILRDLRNGVELKEMTDEDLDNYLGGQGGGNKSRLWRIY